MRLCLIISIIWSCRAVQGPTSFLYEGAKGIISYHEDCGFKHGPARVEVRHSDMFEEDVSFWLSVLTCMPIRMERPDGDQQ